MWIIEPWFDQFLIICQQCHIVVISKTKDKAERALISICKELVCCRTCLRELDRREIQKLQEEATKWHLAWYAQKDATGTSYWNGYSDGKSARWFDYTGAGINHSR